MPSERELQRCHVPAPRTRAENTRAERSRAAVPAEESASSRSGKAVERKPSQALKTTERAARLRPEDPVGRS
jgi:hypothetical protein